MKYTPDTIPNTFVDLRRILPVSKSEMINDLGSVIVTNPADGATGISVNETITWDEIPGYSRYRIKITRQSDSEVVVNTTVEGLSFTPSFDPSTGYDIQVFTAKKLPQSAVSSITGVSLNTSQTTVKEGQTLKILGSVQGTGSYDPRGDWTLESGAVPFTEDGNEITFTGDTEGNSGTFKFKSVQDNSVFVEVTISVTAASIVTEDNSRAGDEESLRLHAEALAVAGWYNSTGWSATTMSLDDNIYGVKTATINGVKRVTEIDLQSNKCIGELPEFPGLHECKVYLVKQVEDGGTRATRITGGIPRSLGHTKVNELSLAGRTEQDYRYSTGNFYNKKNGIPWNQFTGGIPSELHNLVLEFLEIDGQGGQFGGELTAGVSNWRLKRFIATGNYWYDGYNDITDMGFTGLIPSEIKNWVDCEIFLVEDNGWSGIALDAFEGWNEIESRWIMVGNDGIDPDFFWEQELPNIPFSNAYKFSWGGRRIGGDFPNDLFLTFSNTLEFSLGTHNFTGTMTPGNLAGLDGARRFSIARNSVQPMNLEGELFGQNENVAGYFGNAIILFYSQSNRKLGGYVPEGMHEWAQTRYIYMQDMDLQGTLPSKPPAMHGCTFRSLRLERRSDSLSQYQNGGITGSIPADWGKIGATEARGGTLYSGTVSDYGKDDIGFWIKADNPGWTVDQWKITSPTAPGPIVRKLNTSSNNQRRILSNTTDRLYYSTVEINGVDIGFAQVAVGDSFFIHHNSETDVRALNQGINLSNHNMSGTLLAEAAPIHMTGGTYNITGNKFTIHDFVDNIQAWLDMATANGWTFAYEDQQKFGDDIPDVTVNVGQTITIDASAYHATGNDYSWFKDGSPIANTGDTLTIASAASGDDGSYRIEITNTAVPNMTDVSRNIQVTVN